MFATTATLTSFYINTHLKENAPKTDPRDFIPGMESAPKHQFAPGVIPITPDDMRRRLQSAKHSQRA